MFIAGRHTNILKPQRGDRCALSEPRGRIERMARRRKRLYLAPEGRYVYSRATCKYLKAPEGRHVRFV